MGEAKVGPVSGVITYAKVTPLPNGWFRCEVTGSRPGGAGGSHITIGFASAATGNTFDSLGQVLLPPANQTMTLWGAQNTTVLAGSTATSPIVTTTAAVTRPPDSLDYAVANNYNQSTGSFYSEIIVNASSSVVMFTLPSNYMLGTSPNRFLQMYNGGTAAVSTFVTPNETGPLKCASKWVANSQKIFQGGNASSPFALAAFSGSATSFSIGRDPSGFNPNGTIRNVKIYSPSLTDAELQALTT